MGAEFSVLLKNSVDVVKSAKKRNENLRAKCFVLSS